MQIVPPRPVTLDFGKPSAYEAFLLMFASLVISFFFWSVALLGSLRGYGTPSVVAVCLESALDCVSTTVVLYRFAAPDALAESPRNNALEQRTSVWLALTMVLLALLLDAFAALELVRRAIAGSNELTIEVLLSLPSSVLYLVVGMMQLQMSWVLRLGSLKQDAIISILGAAVSLGTLLSAVTNLLVHAEDEEAALVAERGHFGAGTRWRLKSSMHFRYWWLDQVFTIISATIMMLFGLAQLREDTKSGMRWWTYDFWTAPLPPAETRGGVLSRAAKSSCEDRGGVGLAAVEETGDCSPCSSVLSETTPLYRPR